MSAVVVYSPADHAFVAGALTGGWPAIAAANALLKAVTAGGGSHQSREREGCRQPNDELQAAVMASGELNDVR